MGSVEALTSAVTSLGAEGVGSGGIKVVLAALMTPVSLDASAFTPSRIFVVPMSTIVSVARIGAGSGVSARSLNKNPASESDPN